MTLKTNKIFPRDGKQSGAYGGIVQVKYATTDTVMSRESTTYADVPGVSISITPQSASNAILLMLTFSGNQGTGSGGEGRFRYKIIRTVGGTDTTVTTVEEALVDYGTSNIHVQGMGNNIVDTPATTSAVTYKMQICSHNGGQVQINNNGRTDLIVMEISG